MNTTYLVRAEKEKHNFITTKNIFKLNKKRKQITLEILEKKIKLLKRKSKSS